METNQEIFSPNYLTIPGAILEETLEARGIKKREFADRCGKTAKTISEIIAGKAPITPETALQFERVLGVTASLWTNLESAYRLKLAKQEDREYLEQFKDIIKKFPVKALIKNGFMDKAELPALLKFFGVATVDALCAGQEVEAALYKNSPTFKSDSYAVSAWLRCGLIEAQSIETKPYDAENFKLALFQIRSLTKEADIQLAQAKMVELCANAGVAVVFIPELTGTHLCGAARWLSKDKALIQLSLRHKSDDHLWFTFFHESGHILLHGKKDLFVDEANQNETEQEKEADNFADNILIPKETWKEFCKEWFSYSEHIILAFADEQNIAPGIIVGRLQKEKILSYAAKENSLKNWYEFDENRKIVIKNKLPK